MDMPKEFVEFFREQYPPRSRIRLRERETPDQRLQPGDTGILYSIQDDGRFMVKWDKGCWASVRIGYDSFTVLPPETETLKLYMPLAAEVYIKDDFGDYPLYGQLASQSQILGFEDAIVARLLQLHLRDKSERGLMARYEEDNSLQDKVRSVMITAEERNGQLWGVAVCQVTDTLDYRELELLKDFVQGQAADGIGESLESRAFQIEDGKMHVMLWNDAEWDIKTEQERFPMKFAEGLPELCFSVNKSTGNLICIKKGETGYYPSDWNTNNPEENKRLADYNNERLSVTKAQRLAMESGSMFGWDNPYADPAMYEKVPVQNQNDQSLTMGGM